MLSFKTLNGVIDAAETDLANTFPLATATANSNQVSVIAYGAKPDGLTDDSAAIQRASDAASRLHETLYFPAGTYEVSKSVAIASGSTWAGAVGAVLQASNPGASIATMVVANNTSISGLSFVGTGTAQLSAPLLLGYRSAGVNLQGDNFSHTTGIGVLMSDVNGTSITGSNFFDIGNVGAGTSLQQSAQGVAFCNDISGYGNSNVVSGNAFSAIGLDAISATGQTNMSVSNNTMQQLNVQQGWNTQTQAAAGVYENGDVGGAISGNTIGGASGNGIDVINGTGLLVSGNTVTGSGAAGIALSSTTASQVRQNTVSASNALLHFVHDAGITVLDLAGNSHSANLTITDNTINAAAGVGGQYALQEVNVPQSGASIVLSHNTVHGIFSSVLQGFQPGTAF